MHLEENPMKEPRGLQTTACGPDAACEAFSFGPWRPFNFKKDTIFTCGLPQNLVVWININSQPPNYFSTNCPRAEKFGDPCFSQINYTDKLFKNSPGCTNCFVAFYYVYLY